MTRLNRLALICCLSGLGLVLTGCPGDEPTDKPDTGGSTCSTTKCGTKCCGTGEVCFEGGCCAPTACTADMECGTDGCGTECGVCGSGTACNEATWKCEACTAETKAAFCSRMASAGKICGSITDKDICTQAARTEDCGGCSGGMTCAANNTCTGTCTPGTIAQFCAANGKNCGSYTGTECGTSRTENCGVCPNGDTCGANNVCPGTCVYEGDATFCSRVAAATLKVCGSITEKDNCNADKTVNCGTCPTAGQSCNPANNHCETCTAETDTAFCARMATAGKECGSITDVDACLKTAKTVDCGTTACTGTEVCTANVCTGGGTPPPNDTCATAIDITTATMPVTGSTANGTDDSAGSCEGDYYYGGLQDGADVVYSFTISGTDHKSADIMVNKVSGSSYYQAVYVRSDCATSSSELGCKAYASGGSTIKINDLAPGTYFIIVDGEDGSEGDFQLTLTLGAPILPPGNDTCTAPEALTGLDATTGNGTATATGDTTAANNDDDSLGTCGGMGPDVVYSFTIPAGATNKDVTVTHAFTDTTQEPVVYMRKANCVTTTATDEVKCASSYSSSTATFVARNQAPGTYYVWVDGYSGSKGAFTLTVVVAEAAPPPTNDSCGTGGASAKAITLDASGHGSVSDDTSLATTDDGKGDCRSTTTSGMDMVYVIDTAGLGERNVTATLTFTDTGAYAHVYMWNVCDPTVATREIACASTYDNVATITAKHLAAGKYYIWVDSAAGDEGLFTLDVDAVVPPTPAANDYCDAAGTGAKALTLDANGHVTEAGDTLSATDDDAQGLCESTSGKDLVYMVDTTGLGERNLTAKVTFTDTAASATVYIRTVCNSQLANDQLACDHPVDYIATASARRVPAGKYYVWVDEYAGDEGPFTLEIDAVVPPDLTAVCAAATVIDVTSGTGTATGTNVATTNGTTGTCGGDKGNDQVFKFTTTADQKVTVTVTPGATSDLQPVVFLRTDCASEKTADEKACDYGYSSAEIVMNFLPAGTYYVWVDGDEDWSTGGGTSGDFTIEVKLDTAITPPANDLCAGAIALNKGDAPTAGDSTAAVGDYGVTLSSACYAKTYFNGKGPEVVYTYTPTADGDFTVEVIPTFDAMLWYSTGTCGGDGSACLDATDKAGSVTESLVITGVTGTTYYLYVDYYSATGSGGAFTIQVK